MKVTYTIKIEADVPWASETEDKADVEANLEVVEASLVDAVETAIAGTGFGDYPHELPEGRASITVGHESDE